MCCALFSFRHALAPNAGVCYYPKLRGILNLRNGDGRLAGYQTEQRKALLNYMCRHNGKAHTARELAQGIRQDPDISPKPGDSTVYRLLNKMTKEGALRRTTRQGSRQYVFEISDAGCREHLHLRCLSCGKTIHMDEEETRRIAREVVRDSAFALDEVNTVLLGTCAECSTPERAQAFKKQERS